MGAKKSGLGRGLNELLGTQSADPNQVSPSDDLLELPVEFLQRGRYQPRGNMDPATLEELANSIKAHGILQPITVRRIAGGRYEIIAGERRWRAAQLAGLSQVPVIIKDLEDQQAMALALIENVQREDLNPVEQARALQRLIETFGLTHQEVAMSIGKSRAHISNLIRITQCEPSIQRWLAEGALEMGHARALLPLASQQQLSLGQKIIEQKLSVRATERWVKQLLTGENNKPKEKKTHDILHLENALSQRLGAKVVVSQRGRGGSLSIHYNSLDELEGILDRIR